MRHGSERGKSSLGIFSATPLYTMKNKVTEETKERIDLYLRGICTCVEDVQDNLEESEYKYACYSLGDIQTEAAKLIRVLEGFGNYVAATARK